VAGGAASGSAARGVRQGARAAATGARAMVRGGRQGRAVSSLRTSFTK